MLERRGLHARSSRDSVPADEDSVPADENSQPFDWLATDFEASRLDAFTMAPGFGAFQTSSTQTGNSVALSADCIRW